MKSKKKMWSGRFKTPTHPLVETFTSSLPFDRRLYTHDIKGSIAWARALGRAKVIAPKEVSKIIQGLKAVDQALKNGRARFLPQDEDIHMAVERLLTERIGRTGAKLHSGRSRNDQVALDLRLFLREETGKIQEALSGLRKALLAQAKKNLKVAMPGYTHLQRAQPILLSHHLMAYVEMVERDIARYQDALVRIDVLPLGSGALAGTSFPVSRERLAKELGFSKVSRNSLDAVSDRDFAIEFLSASAVLMMHLSRLSEELVLWSTEEFGFVEIPDGFCTGSSLMPQKKNPDVLELIRGKTGRVYGHLLGLLTTMKALPLAYNRDLQEDKEPLFDTVDTIKTTLEVLAELVKSLSFKEKTLARAAGDGFLLATDLADYLVEKGLPFRKAHEAAGRFVRYCIDEKRELPRLSLKELNRFSPLFKEDALGYLTVSRSLARKKQTGATAPRRVRQEIRRGQGK